jgi:hypothetical protein
VPVKPGLTVRVECITPCPISTASVMLHYYKCVRLEYGRRSWVQVPVGPNQRL